MRASEAQDVGGKSGNGSDCRSEKSTLRWAPTYSADQGADRRTQDGASDDGIDIPFFRIGHGPQYSPVLPARR
jgi:hypothetical protein